MRIASYNVENMFRRPRALFDPKTGKANTTVLEAYSRVTQLLEEDSYEGHREEIVECLDALGLKWEDSSEFAVLRKIRGRLLYRPRKERRVEVTADGRGDWLGWVELRKVEVEAVATTNIARVIDDVRPDVLAVVEVEDRMTLERFNEYVLGKLDDGGRDPWRFGHSMLVDGNDERGIDVGLLSGYRFPIRRVRSHVDDWKDGRRIFSRDCAEFEVPTPEGRPLLLMVNHFKSKGYAGKEPPDVTRRRQARQVAKLYEDRREEGWEWIAIAGDLNDTPDSEPLAPLLARDDLTDAGRHDAFEWGERTGTYGSGKDQIDYLLLSPGLYRRIERGGVNRKGVWRGSRTKNPWQLLPTLTEEKEAASDHAAIWVDLDL